MTDTIFSIKYNLKQLNRFKNYNLVFFYKTKILDDFLTLNEVGYKENEQFTLISKVQFIKKVQQKDQKEQQPLTAEEYKERVENLVSFGYNREELIQALIQHNNDFNKALLQLMHGRQYIEEEQIPVSKEDEWVHIQESPYIQGILQYLNTDQWNKILQKIKIDSPNFYKLLMRNEDRIIELMAAGVNQNVQEDNFILEFQDLELLVRLEKEFGS
ncbi:hypothetical protein pb186bvf_007818 [Paramecium bursaria]